MRPSRIATVSQPTRRGEAVILFAVGGTTFAIAAAAVDEIRNTEGLRPLAHSPLMQAKLAKVRHALEREGRTYCVVDGSFHFHMLPAHGNRLLVLRGMNVAVLVDRIDRMAEIDTIHALPRAFSGEECRWYRGLALLPGVRGAADVVVPVVDPRTFLTDAEAKLAEPLLRRREVSA